MPLINYSRLQFLLSIPLVILTVLLEVLKFSNYKIKLLLAANINNLLHNNLTPLFTVEKI